MIISIKNWPENERPREHLLQFGASNLSDAELIAIFLRSGSQQHSAVELARILIQHFGQLMTLLDAPYEDFKKFHGIGPTKYAQLMAVKELGKRYISEHLKQEKLELSNSTLLLDYLKFELLGEMHETFAVLCLDANLRKLHFKKLFFGSLNSCEISINTLLRYCIIEQATFIVIAHNHPLGLPIPSTADIALTEKIQQACQLVDIELIDHCIITSEGCLSFAEQSLLKTIYK